MREETWVGPEGDEVMVNFDLDTGAALRVYTYRDGVLPNEEFGPDVPQVQWLPSDNPMFVYADDPNEAVALMRHLDYTEDNDNE